MSEAQQNWIGGTWVEAAEGGTLDVRNPADGSLAGTVPKGGRTDACAAVDAATAALPGWSGLNAYERSSRLFAWYEYVVQHADDIARGLTSEQGKPLEEARNEVMYGASYIRWYAEEAKRIYGETVPASKPGKRISLLRQPVGVVAAVTPWNFPCAMIARKLAPALAAGCTVVAKPANKTPLTAFALARGLEAAGIPGGVVNMVAGHSADIVSAWMEDARVAKLTFTGSTEVGIELMRQASATVKKVSLELGGHAPALVFDDADLDCAVEGVMQSKFRNAGQTCVCVNRIFVQRPVYDAFVAKLSEAMRGLKIGNGFESGVTVGPLIDAAACDKVERHVRDAVGRGAKLVLGGERALPLSATEQAVVEPGYGNYYKPTLLCDIHERMLIMQEETFGPVAAVAAFDSEEEGIALANDTPYGLAAYFFTENASRGIRVAEALQFGIIGWNDGAPSTAEAPFGGLKLSGIGREGGRHGLEEFLETKYVSFRLADA